MKLIIKNSPNITMAMGFAMVMLLMLSLGFVGLTRIANIYSHMEKIVTDRNVKTQHAQVMKDCILRRAILMHSISVLSDPFDQDAEFIEFNENGALYADAHQRLESMALNEARNPSLPKLRA